MRPLRCLFIITSMPVGGAETLLVNLIRRLDPKVMVAEVVCLKSAGPLGEQISDEIPVHTNLLSSKFDIRVLPKLTRLLRSRRADIVITVGAGDKMFWGRLAARFARVPVVASALHSTGWPDGVGSLNRMLTGITDAFIAVADSHGQFLREFEKFPARKVRVIRNGVDCQRFSPSTDARNALRQELGLNPDTKVVGIVAALRSEKNHAMFMRSASQVHSRFSDAHFVVIGDGPERASIELLCEELGLADRVHLLGTRHDTPNLVAAMDVFALSSLNEASPVSILEALACEVPVVATDVGSVNESVIEGETGFLVESEDVQGMSNAISRLLSDEVLRCSMGRHGRHRVLGTGSLESMVRGYEALATSIYAQNTAGCNESGIGQEPSKVVLPTLRKASLGE